MKIYDFNGSKNICDARKKEGLSQEMLPQDFKRKARILSVTALAASRSDPASLRITSLPHSARS